NVPSSRHVRMDGTHTGKFAAESVRAALRRVHGSAANFVTRGSGGEARPVDETASHRWRSAPIFASARAPRKLAKRKRIRGKEFLSRGCAQKWVPPKAWRFCGTLKSFSFLGSCAILAAGERRRAGKMRRRVFPALSLFGTGRMRTCLIFWKRKKRSAPPCCGRSKRFGRRTPLRRGCAPAS